MIRKLGVLPIGTAWRAGAAAGVVLEHDRPGKAVVVFAAVRKEEPREMRYGEDVDVELLSAPPFPIPEDVKERILENG